jgi:2,3-dihydroxy-p-cumate/2,3-dihydroxybenzoate 3,4-dioxygenase
MIRFRRLGYVALNVTDPERSATFYRDKVGLQCVPGPAAELRYLRCSDKHHDLALYAGKPGLKRIGFELESESEFAPLREALEGAGHACVPIPSADGAAMATGPGVRTQEPVTGATLDFYVTMAPSSASQPFTPTLAKLLRLGHLVLKSPDFDASVAFFTDVLNFKVSDSIDHRVTFLRCFPNPYHHSIGIGNGNAPGLHHVALMVQDADDIGRSYWRLQRERIPVVNGPGRHLPSGSMFLYYLDPDGLTFEYTFGMEEFPEHESREPRLLPPVPESNDIWAGPVDPRKSAVGDIERLALATAGARA